MLEYNVSAKRMDPHGSIAECKKATVTLDTDVAGRDDAFNPAELLLGALAACMIKNAERVSPLIQFDLGDIEIHLKGYRQDRPPKMQRIDYVIRVRSDAPQRKIDLLHTNIRKHGTVYNTLAMGCEVDGRIERF